MSLLPVIASTFSDRCLLAIKSSYHYQGRHACLYNFNGESQSINQSVNLSINQSIINKFVNQSVNQLVNQSIS